MSICARNQLASKEGAPQILVIATHAPSWASVSPFVRGGGRGQASQLLSFLPDVMGICDFRDKCQIAERAGNLGGGTSQGGGYQLAQCPAPGRLLSCPPRRVLVPRCKELVSH